MALSTVIWVIFQASAKLSAPWICRKWKKTTILIAQLRVRTVVDCDDYPVGEEAYRLMKSADGSDDRIESRSL